MTTQPFPGVDSLLREVGEFQSRVAAGMEKLSRIKDEDVQIATAPKDEILRTDKVTLHRYRPVTEQRFNTPVLIVYSLIGRHTMTDLQEDRSLVRNLLAQGVDLWVVDWGNASRADRWLTIDDYVQGYLDDCVTAMCEATGQPKVGMLGICEGGVFALAYAALEPERVQHLILTITPVDFHGDLESDVSEQGFINVWTRSLTDDDVDRMIEVWGVLPGEFMSSIFSMLTPVRSLTKYNLDLLDVVHDDDKLLNFLRMEKWLADRPHHAGEAAKQWLKELYLQNRLIRNEWELGGRQVDLHQVTMPVLNIYAEADAIIPPSTARGLDGKLGTTDYTELGLRGGHIGVFVSSKSQGIVAQGIADWLAERDGSA
jgi:polyhydroxyalkanoate synthase subunit PhaC